jgi:hypothetical protein
MADERRPPENHLLAVLSDADWARLEPHLALIDMPLGVFSDLVDRVPAVRDGGRGFRRNRDRGQ